MNRLLRTQLRRHFGHGAFTATEVSAFLDAVDAAYTEADAHSQRLVRSIELISEELGQRHAELEARAERLAKLNALVVDLARNLTDGTDIATGIARVTETCGRTIGVARASLWAHSGDRLRCLDLFEGGVHHATGMELCAENAPDYFAAIRRQRTVAVRDAQHDPQTREFAASYLVPLGITSMLDAGVCAGTELLGVLCLEHVGPARTWTTEELSFVGSLADLTAVVFESRRRREAERALDSQRVFLRQVIDLTPNLIFAKDADGKFVLANAATAEIYGTTVAGLLGKSDGDFNPNGDQVARFRAVDAEVLRTMLEHVVDAEPITDARGVERWLHTIKRPIVEAGGGASYVLGVATDITAQRRAEQERVRMEATLRQAQKLESIGLLAGGIAHDLNNILTPILMSASVAADTLEPGALREEMVEIVGAAQAARELTGQLLAFGRKQVLALATIDLNDVIRKTLKMIGRMIPAHTRVETRLAPAAVLIHADAAQIQQVLVNLVMNACDAMPSGGSLIVATECTGDAEELVRLVVSDSGVGMNDETLAQIFDPFFTTKELGRGTGLGLATVHGIIEQHGGRIAVRSTPRVGTEFEVVLPRRQRVTTPVAVQQVPDPAAARTILLVEDESPIRRLARRILEADGFTIVAAEHAEEALAAVAHHRGEIDLLLTDVVLPGMSGPALFERLRSSTVQRVVYMSGHARDVLDDLPISSGMRLLRKPFTASDLSTMVRAALATS